MLRETRNISLTFYLMLRNLRRLRWSKVKLEKYQDKCVRSVVYNAFENVAFYRKLLKAKGIYPADIKGVSDLEKIPVINKKLMKKFSSNDLISKEYDSRRLKALNTGGSTGQPFTIYINQKEDAWRKAIYLRANLTCGQRPGDKWVSIIDPQYSSGKNRTHKLLSFYYRNIIPITMPRKLQYKIIDGINPDILDGFPSALRLLAREQQTRQVYRMKPRMIFGSGELIDNNSIEHLEKTFSAPYFDQFGCTEIDRSAWQCIRRQGYHLDCDSVITQFVDKNGNEVSPEEKGEIVYTSLFNYAFPIIRYNIEDIGIKTDDECTCGINLPMMKVVEGRSNSFIVFPDDQIISPMRFIEILGAFKLEREIAQYRVVQETKTNIHIYVRKSDAQVDEQEITNILKNNIISGFTEIEFSVNKVNFDIKFVEQIPFTARGKLNVVTSKVNQPTAY